MPVINVSC